MGGSPQGGIPPQARAGSSSSRTTGTIVWWPVQCSMSYQPIRHGTNTISIRGPATGPATTKVIAKTSAEIRRGRQHRMLPTCITGGHNLPGFCRARLRPSGHPHRVASPQVSICRWIDAWHQLPPTISPAPPAQGPDARRSVNCRQVSAGTWPDPWEGLAPAGQRQIPAATGDGAACGGRYNGLVLARDQWALDSPIPG